MTWKQIRVGDVFSIALERYPDLRGFGQVVGKSPHGLLLTVLHSKTQRATEKPDALAAVASSPIARIVTTDELFYHDYWRVVDNLKVPPLTPFPVYREDWYGPDGRVTRTDVVSFDHVLRRPATADEAARLGNHVSVSAIVLNEVLEATIAGRDWVTENPNALPDPTALERDYFPESERAK